MIIYFTAAQIIASLAVLLIFRHRGYRWSRRHTLLCSAVPVAAFLIWVLFWYLLPADILPERWFDRAPTAGSLSFMCVPPFVISWFLFIIFSNAQDEIPVRFRGEYSFDRAGTIAYWDVQTDWPSEVKEQLVRMAIPTILRIESDRVVVADVASGQSITRPAKIFQIRSDMMKLELHNNFAQANRATIFQFDAGGFWLCEGTLFPNYRERFEKVKRVA